MKKSSASSQRERRRDMKRRPMKTNTKNFSRELRALTQLRDRQIDTSDIPELTDWSKAVVGKFYRPLKEPVTIRLDADIVAQLKAEGPGYQTRINALLRQSMTRDLKDGRTMGRAGDYAQAAAVFSSSALLFGPRAGWESFHRHRLLFVFGHREFWRFGGGDLII